MTLTPTFLGTHLRTSATVPNIRLNAFNVTPGVTFITDDDTPDTNGVAVWIAVHVHRDPNNERVYVWARRGDLVTEGPGDSVVNRSFDFDYCTPVAVVGNVLHPNDPDDNDWGSN